MDLVLKRLAIVVCLFTLPGMAWALSFGEIKCYSHLNQNLDAEVMLHTLHPSEVNDAHVTLASREAHERAGITMMSVHNKLQFKIARKKNGDFVVKVTTKKPVKEPVIEFILDISWPTGRVQRPFSIHLDPPFQP